MTPRDHILIAIKTDRPDIVADLIQQIDITERGKENLTPIEVAVQFRRYNCVRVIIENSVLSKKILETYGAALLDSVRINNIQIARILLKAGASNNWSDSEGNTCLHVAIKNQNTEMITLLSSFGFNLNEQNDKKKSAYDSADSLDLKSLKDGWLLHYNETTTIKMLSLLVLLHEQQNSQLGKLPSNVLNMIVPYLCHPEQLTTSKDFIKFGETQLNKTFAKHLLTYSDRFFQPGSTTYNQLRDNIRQKKCSTEDIAKTMSKFLKQEGATEVENLKTHYPRLWALGSTISSKSKHTEQDDIRETKKLRPL